MTEQTRTILYLDDEPICLDVFQQMFESEYDIRTSMSVEQARGALAASPADIVISDQSMPGIEGIEFLREVARAYPKCCRVMLTGNIGVGNVLGEISSGAVDLFLSKPWTDEGMSRALKRASILSQNR
jgi:DNA-binding NtrC family response regulator